MAPADDSSIKPDVELLRGLKPTELAFDIAGQPVLSDGAFRTNSGLSAFRSDKAGPLDVFTAYPQAARIARLTVQNVRDADCIVHTAEPPAGHVEIYRKDDPSKRISGGSAGKMARKAILTSDKRP
jgi:hypothetical protein